MESEDRIKLRSLNKSNGSSKILSAFYFLLLCNLSTLIAIGWYENEIDVDWIKFKSFQHRKMRRLNTKPNFLNQPIATTVPSNNP